MKSIGQNGGWPWVPNLAIALLQLGKVYGNFQLSRSLTHSSACRPAHLSHKMHFRNVPCSVEPDNPRNPLNILRRLYKPGDYVAFKLVSSCRICGCPPKRTLLLKQCTCVRGDDVPSCVVQDIDNEPIEQALLKQLDEPTVGMIAEFFTGGNAP